MDRGVKIAIFVASIASLGLGLIWDQVLSHARVMVEDETRDVLAPEEIQAVVGSPDIARMDPPEDLETPFVIQNVEDLPPAEEEPAEMAAPWTDYVVQDGDSWWRLAHDKFKDRNLSTTDIANANGNVVLVPGKTIKIPPSKEALLGGVPESEPVRNTSAGGASGETEYVIKDGDSWWKLAHKVFADRNLETADLEAANPGVNLRPGVKVKIPAGR